MIALCFRAPPLFKVGASAKLNPIKIFLGLDMAPMQLPVQLPAKRKVIFYAVAAIGGIVLLFAAYTWLTLSWSYSSGDRSGFMQKLSKKGWICKSWEGELTLVALPGSMPEKFLFTVRDPDLVPKINASMGKRVTLAYEQHKGVPISCFGETEYFAVGVKEVVQ